MCNILCSTCNEPLCEKTCLCPSTNYTNSGCDNPQDFKCSILEKQSDDTNYVFPCLDLTSGDSLLEFLQKVEELKCAFINLPAFTPVDEKVKTSGSDLVSGYLSDKIIANSCITWEQVNVSGNIKLRPVIDYTCLLSSVAALPAFCTAVNACVSTIPVCGNVLSVSVTGRTSTTITFTIIGGVNNTSFAYSLYSDAGLTTQVGATQTLVGTVVTFSTLIAETDYWLKVQPLCSNSAVALPTIMGPIKTLSTTPPFCPTVSLNAPVITNNTFSVTWVGGVGATSYNVYVDGVFLLNQSGTSFTSGALSNGSHVIVVEALPCASGTPNSDLEVVNINYTVPCVPPSNPSFSSSSIANSCPTTSVDLTSLISTIPVGTVIEFYEDSLHTIVIPTPSAYVAGTSHSIYAFAKNTTTGCFSDPTAIAVTVNSCATLPSVTFTCPVNFDINSPLVQPFVKDGVPHSWLLDIPVTVVGAGTITGTISGGGFSGTFSIPVTGATTLLDDITITYDGITGVAGYHNVTISIDGSTISNSPQNCTAKILVVCPVCPSPTIVFSSVTNSGFVSTISNLPVGSTYDIEIINTLTSVVVSSATSQTSPYNYLSAAANTNYTVNITINCPCGNTSSGTSNVTTSSNFVIFENFSNSSTSDPIITAIRIDGSAVQPVTIVEGDTYTYYNNVYIGTSHAWSIDSSAIPTGFELKVSVIRGGLPIYVNNIIYTSGDVIFFGSAFVAQSGDVFRIEKVYYPEITLTNCVEYTQSGNTVDGDIYFTGATPNVFVELRDLPSGTLIAPGSLQTGASPIGFTATTDGITPKTIQISVYNTDLSNVATGSPIQCQITAEIIA